jgi:hypothetical protein
MEKGEQRERGKVVNRNNKRELTNTCININIHKKKRLNMLKSMFNEAK